MSIDVRDESWYAGLTLLERHATMPDAWAPPDDGGSREESREGRAPRSRDERWRSAGPFVREGLFERRLAADGLTMERFQRLVSSPATSVQDGTRVEPGWLRTLAATIDEGRGLTMPALGVAEADGSSSATDAADATNGSDATNASLGFLGLVRPLLTRAFARFREGLRALVERHPEGPVSQDVGERVFLSGLARQVVGLIGRTLVLELHVSGMRGGLRGETPVERFRSFLDDLEDDDRPVALLREYPVLARLVMTTLAARVEARLECLRHVCEDWPAICERFPALAGRTLAGVSATLGDPHRGGRTVLRLRFEPSGALIYKPRSMAVDEHFQELLAWLNARGATPPFRTVEVLDRGNHGWAEAIATTPCETREDVTRFYERLGGYLALLYALEATDFHCENLVACGEHPVLVDLEALFHPRVESAQERSAQSLATEALGRSVLRVGLLPQRVWSHAGFGGIDLSGCGGEPGQRLPQKVPVWQAAGTDQMRLAEQEAELPSAGNRPSLRGEPIDVMAEAPAIERGFTWTYHLLCDVRDDLLAEGGPIQRFANDRVRAILRATRTYGLLLQESTHPDVLRDGLDRDRLFDWLWADVERQPALARAIRAERQDLEVGDVPCFTTTPASRAIWTSTSEEIPDYYEETGLSRVEARLRAMDDEDLERQRWFLRASLTSLELAEREVAFVPGAAALALAAAPVSTPVAATPAASTPAAFIDEAARVAHRLRTLAFVDGTRASWVGLTLIAEEHWSIVPLGVDLYGGLPGIALFLARLASLTGDGEHRRLAEQTTTGLLEQLEPQAAWPMIGAFSGWGGVIYALAHLGPLLEDERCLDRAMGLVPGVSARVKRDAAFDVIGGSAGAILGLAALQSVHPGDRILEAMQACAAHLVSHAERQPVGCGWRTTLPSTAPLVGFSHGAGGIALSLFTVAALTDDETARDTAYRAIEYERSTFVPSEKNWPDFRPPERMRRRRGDAPGEAPAETTCDATAEARTGPGAFGETDACISGTSVEPLRFMTTWCHGAPGIGLARVAGLRHMDDWRVRVEIAEAVRTTIRAGFGSNHCLCHGDLGNLEFLAVAAGRLSDYALRRDVAQIASGLLRSIGERGWQCGVPLHVETPGFMMGLAGIGDGLLRLAEPGLPSVLMLEPPKPLGRGVRSRAPRTPRQSDQRVSDEGAAHGVEERDAGDGTLLPAPVRWDPRP